MFDSDQEEGLPVCQREGCEDEARVARLYLNQYMEGLLGASGLCMACLAELLTYTAAAYTKAAGVPLDDFMALASKTYEDAPGQDELAGCRGTN